MSNKQIKLDEELKSAVLQRDIHRVRSLLEQGANPNARLIGYVAEDMLPDPPVLEVVFSHNEVYYPDKTKRAEPADLIEALLSHGAKPNISYQGRIPIICRAAGLGYSVSVCLLLKYGANPNAWSDRPGRPTVLHEAVCSCNLATIQMLVEKGADVNDLSEDGFSALYQAISYLKMDIASYLEQVGGEIWPKGYFDTLEQRQRYIKKGGNPLLKVSGII